MIKQNDGVKGRGQRIFALSIMFVIETLSVILLIYCLPGVTETTLRLPLMVLFGVISFLGALTIAASVLNFYGLSNPLEALGLPSGSVRALIALSLILIFALMVIFMANNLDVGGFEEFPANSTVVFEGKEYTSGNGTMEIFVGPSKAAVDFSMQVLTTVSTLVVALAGFYFGTRSVAQAQKSTEPPEASLSFDPSSPAELQLEKTPKKPEENTLPITIKTTPENEVITYRQPDQGTIERTDDPNKFVYKPPASVTEAFTVKLRFWMVRYSGDVEELEVSVKPPK